MLKTPIAAAALLSAGLSLAATPTAEAVDLQVQLTGVDIYFGFDGSTNVQSGKFAGAPDQVDAATFFVDDVAIGTLQGFIQNSFGLPGFDIDANGGVTQQKYGLGFINVDFDTPNGSSGWLDLSFRDALQTEVYYTGRELGISIFGSTAYFDEESDQQLIARLPEWQGFDESQTFKITYTSTDLRSIIVEDGKLKQFQAKGTLNIVGGGAAVPEPSSLAAIGLGTVGLLARRRRR